MKKLYLLTALLLVTAGNIFAMNNDSDTGTDRASQITEVASQAAGFLDSDSDDDAIFSHEQYRQKITAAVTRTEWATAKNQFREWIKLYKQNPAHPDAYENLAHFTNCGNQILAHASHNGHGQKRPFVNFPSTMVQIQAAVNNAHQNNIQR